VANQIRNYMYSRCLTGDLRDMEFPTNIEEIEVEAKEADLDLHDEWMDILGSGDLKKKVDFSLKLYSTNQF